MSDKTILTIGLECDACGKEFIPMIKTKSPSSARKQARVEGWRCSEKYGIDHCDECKADEPRIPVPRTYGCG